MADVHDCESAAAALTATSSWHVVDRAPALLGIMSDAAEEAQSLLVPPSSSFSGSRDQQLISYTSRPSDYYCRRSGQDVDPTQMASSHWPSKPHSFRELLGNSSWNLNTNMNMNMNNMSAPLTMPEHPTTGLNIIAAPSDCALAAAPNFGSDPAFVERAAKFSCFNHPPHHLTAITSSSSLPDLTAFISHENVSNKGHLQPLASSHPGLRNSSMPNSPSRRTALPSVFLGHSEEEVNHVQQHPAVKETTKKRKRCSNDETSRKLLQQNSLVSDQAIGGEAAAAGQLPILNNSEQGFVSRKRKPGPKESSNNGISSSQTVNSSPQTCTVKRAEELEDETKGKQVKSPEINSSGDDNQKSEVDEPKHGNNSGDSTDVDQNIKPATKENTPSKPPEQPRTDYIHVRARRGQATDSHSLAERVRREKISERMKFLQDLVPGCSKVTGKAVMLDEIINYVQSLQRQVEFLSMKLAALNPALDMNQDRAYFYNESMNEVLQSRAAATTLLFSAVASENAASAVPVPVPGSIMQIPSIFSSPLMVTPPVPGLRRTMSSTLRAVEDSLDEIPQVSQTTSWEDELHSFVRMGFAGPGTPQASATADATFEGL